MVYFVDINNAYLGIHAGTRLDPFSFAQFYSHELQYGDLFLFRGERTLSSEYNKGGIEHSIDAWDVDVYGPWRILNTYRFACALGTLSRGIVEADSVYFKNSYQMYLYGTNPLSYNVINGEGIVKDTTIHCPRFDGKPKEIENSVIVLTTDKWNAWGGSIYVKNIDTNRTSFADLFEGDSVIVDQGGNGFGILPLPTPPWNSPVLEGFRLGSDKGPTFEYPVPDLYNVPSVHTIEFSENEEQFNTEEDQLFDEHVIEKDWKPKLGSKLVNNFDITKAWDYINDEYYEYLHADIRGADRTEAFIDCGPYEIDGSFSKDIHRYVNLLPAKNIVGNDGYCNVLLHLDTPPIIDSSSRNHTVNLNGVQIRNNYAVLKEGWSLIVPCEIDIDKGFTVEFRMKTPIGGNWVQELGFIIFPCTVVSESGILKLLIEGTEIILGSYASKYHIAFQYYQENIKVFVNGILFYDDFYTIENYSELQLIIGSYTINTANDGEIHINQFRLSNTLRYINSFSPPQEGEHFADFGKLGWYHSPMSQHYMEKQLEQLVCPDTYMFHVWGNSGIYKEQKEYYNVTFFYIESNIKIIGFQNDSRGIPILYFKSLENGTSSKNIYIDPNNVFEILGVLLLWDLKEIDHSNLFNFPPTEEKIKFAQIGYGQLKSDSVVLTGEGTVLPT